MKSKHDARWVTDSHHATLYVGRTRRAEVHTGLNIATIRTPQGVFRKAHERSYVVGVDKVIIAEIEKELGYGPLPILDKNGNPQLDARRKMEERALSFRHWDNRPTPDPVGEARACLDLALNALNSAAREGHLNKAAADARSLCMSASIAIGKEQRFSQASAVAIQSAYRALTEAIGQNPVSKSIRFTAAAIHCRRADTLARMYGPAAAQAKPLSPARDETVTKNSEDIVRGIVTEKVTITKGNPDTDLWLRGYVTRWPAYTFEAKVFDVGSSFGIDSGRVSKLSVWHKGEPIIDYDRGWDTQPQSWKEKVVLKELLAGFPDANDKSLSAKTKLGNGQGRGF